MDRIFYLNLFKKHPFFKGDSYKLEYMFILTKGLFREHPFSRTESLHWRRSLKVFLENTPFLERERL